MRERRLNGRSDRAEGAGLTIELSVVVACAECEATFETSIRSISEACSGLSFEILVCYPADAAPPDTRLEESTPVSRVPVSGDVLVPDLWGAGLAASRGGAVAFTTAHFSVGRGWARALLDAMDDGWSGAAGPITIGDTARSLDRAIYLLRYSAFAATGAEGPVADIPGDNAAYAREALDLYPDSAEDGFWEIDLHERIRDAGGRLAMVPDAEARYGRSYALGSIVRQRFRHGKHFSRFRIRRGTSWWRIALVAPAVPAVMLLRIFRRATVMPGGLGAFLTAAPSLVVLTLAWAGGEAAGALTSSTRARDGGASAP